MKNKQLLCLLLTALYITTHAQSNVEKKSLIGTWTVNSVSYGDYYYYSVKDDKIEVREALTILIESDSKRFDNNFLASLKKKAAEYAEKCSFTINGNGTYTMVMGGKTESGSYSFLPLYITPRQGSIEEDITYNMDHKNDLAILEFSNGKEISIYKSEGGLNFYTSNKAKGANYGVFGSGVFFKK